MFGDALRRFVLLIAFITALVSLVINLALGRNLAHAAFWAICVMMGVAIILFLAAQSVAKILMVYLYEQRKAQVEQEQAQAQAQTQAKPERKQLERKRK